MFIKKHIIGYSKVLSPRSEGLDWILEHGEENLFKYENKKFKNWYDFEKPAFFQYLHVFEKFAKRDKFGLSFFIFPNQIKVSYAFENYPTFVSLNPPFSFYRENRGDLNPKQINEIWIEGEIVKWESALSKALIKRVEPFLLNDPKINKKLPLLRGSEDLEKLQIAANKLLVTLDQIMGGVEI